MMPNVDPRQLKKIMRRMGVSVENIEEVEKVTIQTKNEEHVFDSPDVTIMVAQGQKTYQISGEPKVIKRMKEEDIQLISEKTGKSMEEARKALEKADGNIAQAIIDLSS